MTGRRQLVDDPHRLLSGIGVEVRQAGSQLPEELAGDVHAIELAQVDDVASTLDALDAQVWETEFPSLDGLRLAGTQIVPHDARHAAVLVQGGDAAGGERAFLARLAVGLAGAGVACLRFDLRAHGRSEGRQEALTLSGLVNDIRAAVEIADANAAGTSVSLVGTGLCGPAPASCSPPATRS